MIPGIDILDMALSVIAASAFDHYAFASRVKMPNGQYLANYAAPVTLQGSAQPVPRNLYANNGLDFQKLYFNFFVSNDVIDVNRDVSGDMIFFGGALYQCQSVTPWFSIDGWNQILAVKIQNIPLVIETNAPTAGNYETDDVLTFTVKYNQPVTVIGPSYITLAPIAGLIHGNATYLSGSGTATLTYQYIVIETDTAAGITAASPVVGNIASSAAIPANSTYVPASLTGVTLNA